MSTVADFVFYLFAAILVGSAVRVVTTRNPVHSVLYLVLSFFTASALFVLLGAEFLAVVLVMVYMGAVAILFLFVVMMLDVDFSSLRTTMRDSLPTGIVVGGIVLVELVAMAASVHVGSGHAPADVAVVAAPAVSNSLAVGRVLYSQYLYHFEIASLVLLVALIGAIVLALRERPDQKRQQICEQLAMTRDRALTLKKVAPGEGA
jgi:NADH-quinone oxidoreductase subunit J